jgi:hypothetical protein
MKVAILDDYQNVALKCADWTGVSKRAEITVFNDHVADAEALVARLRPYDVLAVMRERTPLRRDIIERLPNLKMIASNAPRNASIDLAAAAERGIIVTHSSYSSTPTVELTWALILAGARHITAEAAAVRAGKWQHTIGEDLAEKTLGIVGLGSIGARVAKVAQAFGMNVIAWSQNLTAEKAAAGGAKLVSKEELFRRRGEHTFGPERSHPGTGGRRGAGADETHGPPGQHLARTPGRRSGAHRGAVDRENCRRRNRCLRHRTVAAGSSFPKNRPIAGDAAYRIRVARAV